MIKYTALVYFKQLDPRLFPGREAQTIRDAGTSTSPGELFFPYPKFQVRSTWKLDYNPYLMDIRDSRKNPIQRGRIRSEMADFRRRES
jgi:hypothetical protein